MRADYKHVRNNFCLPVTVYKEVIGFGGVMSTAKKLHLKNSLARVS